MEFILGVDIGTGSLQLVLYNQKGEYLAEASQEYCLYTERSGYSEQNPNDWKEAFNIALDKIFDTRPDSREKIRSIGLSGQMHSLVLLDEQDNIIRPAILWNDLRCSEEVWEIESRYNILSSAYNKALEGFTLPKLMWVKKHEKDNWNKISKFFLPSSYLSYCLTGVAMMDYSDASGTLLLDFDSNEWNQSIFDDLELPISSAPNLTWASENPKKMIKSIQKSLGFSNQNIYVFSGSADNAASAFAANIAQSESAMLSIGTSGVLLSMEEKAHKRYNGNLHLFHHVLSEKYYSMGVTLSAGKSLSWYKELISPDQSFDEFLSEIDDVKPGSEGLLFSPYIMGERTPYSDPNIRASFIGMDVNHKQKHFIRSILEGICFSLKDSYQIMVDEGKQIEKIVSVGGGSLNDSWLQMQSDIFNVPIFTLGSQHGPAMGAAMIAALGMSYYESSDELVKDFVQYDKKIFPLKENVYEYQKLYSIYQKIYKQTKIINDQLIQYRY